MQRRVCGAGRRYFLCGTLIVLWLSGLAGISARAQTFADPGFSSELVTTLPPFTAVGLAFAPDGRMFVWQRDGVVRIFKNGALLPAPFINIGGQVNQFSDRGMLGLALHPNFAGNGFVYLCSLARRERTPAVPGPKSRA